MGRKASRGEQVPRWVVRGVEATAVERLRQEFSAELDVRRDPGRGPARSLVTESGRRVAVVSGVADEDLLRELMATYLLHRHEPNVASWRIEDPRPWAPLSVPLVLGGLPGLTG